MLPTLLIWDFNGTLLNDGHILVDVNNEMNRRHGFPEITYEYYRENFSHPPKPFYEKLGFDFTKVDYAELSRVFLEVYEERQHTASLSPNVEATLRWAEEKQIPQIIVSAHKQDMLERHLERLGIRHFFSHVSGESSHVIGGKVERAKTLAESGQFDFSRSVLIGDTSHDYKAACAMGADCILYSGGHETVERLSSAGVPIIHDFAELPALLEQ